MPDRHPLGEFERECRELTAQRPLCRIHRVDQDAGVLLGDRAAPPCIEHAVVTLGECDRLRHQSLGRRLGHTQRLRDLEPERALGDATVSPARGRLDECRRPRLGDRDRPLGGERRHERCHAHDLVDQIGLIEPGRRRLPRPRDAAVVVEGVVLVHTFTLGGTSDIASRLRAPRR